MVDKTGQCLCGAVSFIAVDMSDSFSICHCKMCQRWAGSAFKGVSAPTDKLTVSGSENVGVFKSSDWGERAHCTKCGSVLWYRLTDGPYIGGTSLAIGLLDDSDGLTVSREYFVDYKNSADVLPDSRQQMTEAEVMAMFAPSKDEV
ncbi:MAG: GFA family protein [Marinosulfonomonas sp.]|nr:GFA family protein [Marinosulfonomonas sp.]